MPQHRLLAPRRMAITLSFSPSQQLSPSRRLPHHSQMTCDTGTICSGSWDLGKPSIRHTSTVDKTQLGRPRRHHIPHRTRTTRAMVPDVVPLIINHTRITTCTPMPPDTDCRSTSLAVLPSPPHVFITVHLDNAITPTHSTLCSDVAELLSLAL